MKAALRNERNIVNKVYILRSEYFKLFKWIYYNPKSKFSSENRALYSEGGINRKVRSSIATTEAIIVHNKTPGCIEFAVAFGLICVSS